MNLEFIMAMHKFNMTHDNGRDELPWDFRKNVEKFVTISVKPMFFTIEQFERCIKKLQSFKLIPRDLTLEKVIRIPTNDNRVNEILHGLRNRKFSYH